MIYDKELKQTLPFEELELELGFSPNIIVIIIIFFFYHYYAFLNYYYTINQL